MLKRFLTVFLAGIGLAGIAAGQEMVLNGDFSNNSAGQTVFNMPNAAFNQTIADCTAFGGAGEIDLVYGSDWGPQPPVGNTKLGLHFQGGGEFDAFSATLIGPVFPGQTYRFQCDTVCFPKGGGRLEFGISNSPIAFGTLFYATDLVSNWVHHDMLFVAPTTGQYLTVRIAPAGGSSDGISAYGFVTQLSLISWGTALARVIQLTAIPREIKTGQRSYIVVYLDRPAPPGGARFTVNYSSTALRGPATVTVPAGRRTLRFATFGDNRASSLRRVDVTVSNPISSATTYVLVYP